jgi:aminomethyltransferase
MEITKRVRRTPLYAMHGQLGGRMIDFHGWEMPVQYSGIIDEHRCVRESVGIFDLSHMGEFRVMGRGALDFLQLLTTRNLEKSKDGYAYYSCICREDGGIVDDLIVYRKEGEDFLVVVNASNVEKDFQWFEEHVPIGVELENMSYETVLIAVQGPKAVEVVQPLVTRSVDDLYFYQHREEEIAGRAVLLARTGYTGEDGFEMYLANKDAEEVWNAVWEQGEPLGIRPIGLGARDTLRLEMGYSLYGNEMDERVNPIEAGLGWVVSKNKRFIGSDVVLPLKESGTNRRIAGFRLTKRGIPRQHYAVRQNGRIIGEVTSGTMSPSLNCGIGLGMIDSAYTAEDTDISIEIRGSDIPATIVKIPFVDAKVYRKPK